jgi:hypothetical protein
MFTFRFFVLNFRKLSFLVSNFCFARLPLRIIHNARLRIIMQHFAAECQRYYLNVTNLLSSRGCSRRGGRRRRLPALRQCLQPGQLHARRRRQLNLLPLRQLQRGLRCQRARAQQQRAAHDGVVLVRHPAFPRLRQRQLGGRNTRQLQLLGGGQSGEGRGQQVSLEQLQKSKRQRRCAAVSALNFWFIKII